MAFLLPKIQNVNLVYIAWGKVCKRCKKDVMGCRASPWCFQGEARRMAKNSGTPCRKRMPLTVFQRGTTFSVGATLRMPYLE